MKYFAIIFLLCFNLTIAISQDVDLLYYLPDIQYNPDIPTPKEFIGHEVGEMHVTHDKLYYYMRELDRLSDRITMTEYARTHENRPLIYLTVTSPKNHQNIEFIRTEHSKLTDPAVSSSVNIDNLPIVIYQGNSIHGNEPSGSNGALAMAYYLAAAQGAEIERLLDQAIILFDPSFNPDGLQRFSTWANTHKGKQLVSDINSREFDEVWPGGRTNHYWFDLNRDWLLLTHPESRGRIETFHHWKPDILTDHHEMGSNSTFFFQPGIPPRTNPNTPNLNQELTWKIGTYHAAALDDIGSLYYTKESYDDFYYGKGSTYPDIQGSIGILFEQASSRGHLQETDHGLLSFPFTIRNQVATMFSTQKAGLELRKNILEYKRQSFLEAKKLAKANPVKAYIFGDTNDAYKVNRFIDILMRHQIDVYQLAKNSGNFEKDKSFIIPLEQNQYRLVKSIFETVHDFADSLFYDVSAWTLPLAFDIPYTEVNATAGLIGAKLSDTRIVKSEIIGDEGPAYAFLVEWNQYLAPRLLYQLHQKSVVVKIANEPFTSIINGVPKEFDRGTLIIHSKNYQTVTSEALAELMIQLSAHNHLKVYKVKTGMVSEGVSLGSRSTSLAESPKMMMLIGEGVRSYDAGELWHHFDQVLEMAVPMVELSQFNRINLDKYNTIVMPSGNYNTINGKVNDLKDWVKKGGTIIAFGTAIEWLRNKELLTIKSVSAVPANNSETQEPYSEMEEQRGALFTGGMIATAKIDLTHPLFYGYARDMSYFFRRGNSYYDPTGYNYSAPARYTADPVASGYLHETNKIKMANSAAVFTENMGRGNIIAMTDNPVFRGYWWGGSKLLANALFFGKIID